MDYYGMLWIIMECYGMLWNVMDYYGLLWIVMGYYLFITNKGHLLFFLIKELRETMGIIL